MRVVIQRICPASDKAPGCIGFEFEREVASELDGTSFIKWVDQHAPTLPPGHLYIIGSKTEHGERLTGMIFIVRSDGTWAPITESVRSSCIPRLTTWPPK